MYCFLFGVNSAKLTVEDTFSVHEIYQTKFLFLKSAFLNLFFLKEGVSLFM